MEGGREEGGPVIDNERRDPPSSSEPFVQLSSSRNGKEGRGKKGKGKGSIVEEEEEERNEESFSSFSSPNSLAPVSAQ